MSLRALLVALLGLSLAAAQPAFADIVLHDGGVERDRDAADVVLRRTGQAPRMVLSGDVLAGPTRLLVSNAEIEQCEGGAIKLKLQARIDDVVESVLSFELEQAIESLQVLETLLPCAEEVVSAEVLTKLAFLRGAALFDQGDEAGATASMKDVLALDPAFEGLRGFPQPHLDLLARERAEATALPKAPLYSWHRDGSLDAFIVDGVTVADPAHAGVAIKPGRHLVQIREAGGLLRGLWLRTTGVPAVLVHPGSGKQVWDDGGRSPGGEIAVRLLLLTEFQGRDGDIHVLRFKGRRVVSAATFPAGGGARVGWEEASGDDPPASDPEEPLDKAETERPVRERPVRERPESSGETRVRFAIGGGYQYVHPYSYGGLALDLGVRLVGPVTLTAFARPSYGGQFTVDIGEAAPVTGAIVLVPFGIGGGVQKPTGAIAPFVFGVFQGAINQVLPYGGFMAGAAIQGGADFAPGDGPFIVRVQGEAGFLGTTDGATGAFFPAFTGRVWVGAGARF